MKEKGATTRIAHFVQNSKQETAGSPIVVDALCTERPCSFAAKRLNTTLRNQKSQDTVNICLINPDGDIRNIELSETGSDFAGFSSPANSKKHSSSNKPVTNEAVQLQKCNPKVKMNYLNDPQQERTSVNTVRGSVDEADVELQRKAVGKRRRGKLNDLDTVDKPEKSTVNQVVEINSKSTTSTEVYRRHKLHSKLQLRLLFNQQIPSNNHNKKCSTESTSDFPVSSPSNPHARSALQKNTLPADVFDRNLALLTSQNPQMTLEEKINSWKCDLDLSDVEDVGSFDDLFKQHEELKRQVIYGKSNFDGKRYDFTAFRNKVLPRLNTTKTPKEKTISSKIVATLSGQRRMRAALELDGKKRQQIERLREKGGATPTITSSSEHELAFNSTSKQTLISVPQKCHGQIPRRKSLANVNQICSESKNKVGKLGTDKSTRPHSQSAISTRQSLTFRRHKPSTDKESVFKLRRLNREIDKIHAANSRGLIQMRLDFEIANKSQHLLEKRRQLFKTPTVPEKYLQTPAQMQLPMPTPKAITTAVTTIAQNTSGNEFPAKNKIRKLISASSFESDRSCSAVSQNSAATATVATIHQQHEFCNYLGLTGMSTANAVANAVAELSKCNLTRRSLRVRHLQQQEKKCKEQNVPKSIAKEDGVEHERLTGGEEKCLDEIVSNHGAESGTSSGSKSQLHFTERSSTSIGEVVKDLPLSAVTVPALEKEPEIKIVCQLSANVDKVESVKNCTQSIVAPMRPKLLRQSKPIAANSNDTSTCPRSSISEAGDGDEASSNRTLKPTQHTKDVDYLKPCELHKMQNSVEPKSSLYSSLKNSINSKNARDSENIKQQLYYKIQKYLEASRKIKPSIFIVQSLPNAQRNQNSQIENKVATEASLVENSSSEIQPAYQPANVCKQKQQNIQTNEKIVDKKNKNKNKTGKLNKKELSKLLAVAAPWHKIKNHRQLRNRKILLVRRIKSVTKGFGKATKICDKADEKKGRRSTVVSIPLSEGSNAKIPNSPETFGEKQHKHKKPQNKRPNKNKGDRLLETTLSPAIRPSESPDGDASQTDTSLPTKSNLIRLDSYVVPAEIIKRKTVSSRDTGSQLLNHDENVVVSSTTNSYDEATLLKLNNSASEMPPHFKPVQDKVSHSTITKDDRPQSAIPVGIHYLSTPGKPLANPAKTINGRVDYVYYEMDVLIIVQEKLVSFWKYFKLINVLAKTQCYDKYDQRVRKEQSPKEMSSTAVGEEARQWVLLGDCRRLAADKEVSTSYANRICVHNSIPIYVEMRYREMPRERRDCNLLSMYINIYYYNDDVMAAKTHSIQLDAVQGLPTDVVYTTITESRYFVMAWPQQNILGKLRSGLCKYSLTPNLDTLASIRDFKHMRHYIRYLECSTDDKLIGFGDTQLTIWDHRSGDVLMNYDFNINLGRNLGSVHYPSLEIGQNSMLLLFQYITKPKGSEQLPEITIFACSVSHTTPSHRILRCIQLPTLAFDVLENATNTGDHIVVTAKNDEEIWINLTDAATITRVPPQHTRRFYARGRSQLIELTDKTLNVDSFANHVLKLAATSSIECSMPNYGVHT